MRGICIDLGTSNSVLSLMGKNDVFSQPSYVTIDTEESMIIDAGVSSKEAYGKTPENILSKKPLSGGVIADYSAAEGMVKLLVKKAFKRAVFTGINAIVSVPASATQMERRAATEVAKNLGVSNVKLIEGVMAAAIGAGINVLTPTGSMIVDIGGGTTDSAVIALGNIATGVSIKTGGEDMDSAIMAHVKRKYNILIGENTAEKIKIDLACALPKDKNSVGKYKGRDIASGLPKEFTVSCEEVREAIGDELNAIVESVILALEKTPAELLSDVMETGITITGGCANIYKIDELLTKKTGFRTKVAQNPSGCTLRGEIKIMSDKKLRNLGK
ncbi:MAG: rod shape-determining protein [Clostridia bacterium]